MGNVLGSYRERELAYKEVFGEPQLLDFETIKISGHADPDAYLTKIYVDDGHVRAQLLDGCHHVRGQDDGATALGVVGENLADVGRRDRVDGLGKARRGPGLAGSE